MDNTSTPMAPGVEDRTFVWPDPAPLTLGLERQKAIMVLYDDNDDAQIEEYFASIKREDTAPDIKMY